jgi:hypothetical protein
MPFHLCYAASRGTQDDSVQLGLATALWVPVSVERVVLDGMAMAWALFILSLLFAGWQATLSNSVPLSPLFFKILAGSWTLLILGAMVAGVTAWKAIASQ